MRGLSSLLLLVGQPWVHIYSKMTKIWSYRMITQSDDTGDTTRAIDQYLVHTETHASYRDTCLLLENATFLVA